MLIIEKLVFIQHLTHRALGTDNIYYHIAFHSYKVRGIEPKAEKPSFTKIPP